MHKKRFSALCLALILCTSNFGGTVGSVPVTLAAENQVTASATETKQVTPITAIDFLNLMNPSDLIRTTVTEQQANEIREKVNEIIKDKKTDYEKAAAIHQWVNTNVTYDYGTLENPTFVEPYDVFTGKRAVCGGFSNLTAEMMCLAGIPAVAVIGRYDNDTPQLLAHQWNAVYVNDQWILVDSTGYGGFNQANMKNTHLAYEIMDTTIASGDLQLGYYQGLAVVGSNKSNVTIPTHYQEVPITSISYLLFSGQSMVEHVTISENISLMDIGTLKSSFKIKSITVAEGNTRYCSSDGALFSADKTELLVYPAGSTSKDFTLPKETVKLDMKDAFGSPYLENIYVEDGNTAFSSYEGVLYNPDKSVLKFVPPAKTVIPVYENASIDEMAFACADPSKVTIVAKPGSPAAEFAQLRGIRFEEEKEEGEGETSHTHKMTLVSAKSSTCQDPGNIQHYKCEDCGLFFEDKEGKKQLEKDDVFLNTSTHSFGEWAVTTPATCSSQGIETRTCTVCKKETETRATFGSLPDHSFGAWAVTTPATCSSQGVETRTCTVCKDETETRVTSGSLPEHSFGEWSVTTPATCSSQGVETRTCTVCKDETETRTTSGSLPEHSFGEWFVTTPATCSSQGVETRTCTVCKDETETRATSGSLPQHSFGEWSVTTPATCSSQGVETRTCTVCKDETETRATSGSLLEHSFGAWTVTTPASLQTDGILTTGCKVCKQEDSQVIGKISSVQLDKTALSYTGKNQTVNVIVTDSNQQIIPQEYYTVAGNRKKNPGTYTVTITFSGKYTGTATATFEIQAPTTSFSKVKTTKNTITLNWKPQKAGIKGYKIQYSTDKKFKKNVKTIEIKKKKTTKTTLKKLKSKKKYYIRICTYKGKTMSKWSKVKAVKTK